MFWRQRGEPRVKLTPEPESGPNAASKAPAPVEPAPESSGRRWIAASWGGGSGRPIFVVNRIHAFLVLGVVGGVAALFTDLLDWKLGIPLGALAGAFLPEILGILEFTLKVAIVLALLGVGLYFYVTNYVLVN